MAHSAPTLQRWINSKQDRYYLVDLTQDLFGDWILVLCWGALGSRRGRLRLVAVPSRAEGLMRLEAIARRRQQRGYRLQSDPSTEPATAQNTSSALTLPKCITSIN